MSDGFRDLIARLKSDAAADWQLDCEILDACGAEISQHLVPPGHPVFKQGSGLVFMRWSQSDSMSALWPVSGSLDAAIRLFEKMLPGWTIGGIGQDDRKRWHCEIREGFQTSYDRVVIEWAYQTPARAVCAALLQGMVPEDALRKARAM